jgi:lysophospholipase L1-like esterase
MICFWIIEIFSQYLLSNNLIIKEFNNNNSKNIFINKTNGIIYSLNGNISTIYALFDINNVSKNKRNDSVYRILIIGDSYTKGLGVKEKKDTYPSQLILKLNNMTFKNITYVEVLPFAMGGMNSFQEYFILSQLASKYQTDLIILQYSNNDAYSMTFPIRMNTSYFAKSKDDLLIIKRRWIPKFGFINNDLNKIILKSSFVSFLSLKTKLNLKKTTDIDINNSIEYVLKMKNVAESMNATFIIINFPEATISSNDCDNAIAKSISNFSKSNNIPYYSLCSYFNPRGYRQNSGGIHYNKEGYNLTANVIADIVYNYIIYNN